MLQVQETSAMMCSEFSQHHLSFGTPGGVVPQVDSTRTQYGRREIDLAGWGTRNTRRPPYQAECHRDFGCTPGGPRRDNCTLIERYACNFSARVRRPVYAGARRGCRAVGRWPDGAKCSAGRSFCGEARRHWFHRGDYRVWGVFGFKRDADESRYGKQRGIVRRP